MTHEFGYWKDGKYVCNHCDTPQKRDGEDCRSEKDYIVGSDLEIFTRGYIAGLEASANTVRAYNESESVVVAKIRIAQLLRDEAKRLSTQPAA